ncbi:MAG: 3-hydroxy-3-methylglutaryl CoA synthase [Candidatus Anoxymicrobium japonicum]|uniref:3-hydroxy-3-methylglutaryl CoA synthase n=1 Tax=Candidatus Anoxymicrobium japonicum TaxID=2013648 RepID=A0A2N3G512_9ACTN|nr:MAG: 3-hydroxy-3-methylglutaryl CoA synthase [Candidatus Anoxymicrobium japonicum]
MVGIRSYGGYVPRYRLNRMVIFGSMGWINPANILNAQGEKAVANFDEDAVTMAAAAAIDCVNGFERSEIGGVYFASTTAPYRERLCANLVAGALATGESIRTVDFAGGLKAGASGLMAALDAVAAGSANNVVVSAADCRLGKMGSVQELMFADAAGAVMVGNDDVIAEYKGSFSMGHDFVDHVRGAETRFDRQWEERWIRDIGFGQFIPEAVNGLCAKHNVAPGDFAKIIYPCYYGGARKAINKKLGLEPDRVQDNMQAVIGDAGTAQPMIMLARALEDAAPGDKIMLVSYGNGCDALFFEVTDAIRKLAPRRGVSGCLARRADLDNYQKYLVWRGMAPVELGLRSEEQKWTRWSLMWRDHRAMLSLTGSRCKACGTPQFPPQKICVNPNCGAVDDSLPHVMSDKGGKIFSFTSDMLAATINPPAMYGAVDFNGGGRYMFDFTDCGIDDLAVGGSVEFSFRVKHRDDEHDITNYFWKAVPVAEGAE